MFSFFHITDYITEIFFAFIVNGKIRALRKLEVTIINTITDLPSVSRNVGNIFQVSQQQGERVYVISKSVKHEGDPINILHILECLGPA